MKIYTITYEGKLSSEGYDSIDKAINRLKKQGYKPTYRGNWFEVTDGRNVAKIYEIKIV